MSSIKTLIATVSAVFLAGPQLFADDACQSPRTPYDRTYCAAKLFLESDNELNSSYKDLKQFLGKNEVGKLVSIQRQWIKFRDEKCSNQGTIEVQCNFDVNKNRTNFLRDRVRECKTGHCRQDLMFVGAF